MRILHFKAYYKIDLESLPSLLIDPVNRILSSLKMTTLRLKIKKMGDYRVRQGNYMKPCCDSANQGWYLHIFMIEQVAIRDLSLKQIKFDIGLTKDELKMVLECYSDIHSFFLEQMRKINHNHLVLPTDTLYLHHFEIENIRTKQITLDDKVVKSELNDIEE